MFLKWFLVIGLVCISLEINDATITRRSFSDKSVHDYLTENDDSKSEEAPTVKPGVPQAVKNWPEIELNLGQVSGVSVNSKLQPVVFHRGDRAWDENYVKPKRLDYNVQIQPRGAGCNPEQNVETRLQSYQHHPAHSYLASYSCGANITFSTFNDSHYFQQTELGPIREHTVLTLDPKTGRILSRWGDNMFYMPHGLTIDRHDNLWVTDVALHQVFKFRPGEDEPSLVFGQSFQPGDGWVLLCKPTHVAVATTGEIFIADGYCNSRILKYNAAGGLLRVMPNPPEFLSLLVPHALALIEPLDRICIADRENMRVTCPGARLIDDSGNVEALTIYQPDMGRVFGVAAIGTTLYAVNGPTSSSLQVKGLTIDPQSESVIDHWATEEGFRNPHAIAACPNSSALYVVEIGPNKIWKFELKPSKNEKK